MFDMCLVYREVLCHLVSWIHAGMRYEFPAGRWRYLVVTWLSFGVLDKLVGTVESASTIVPADAPT
jgi:hypothetical protein